MGTSIILFGAAILVAAFLFGGIRIVRPTHRGLIETLGKYTKFAEPGFHWIIPGVQRMFQVNITEQMVNATAAGYNNE